MTLSMQTKDTAKITPANSTTLHAMRSNLMISNTTFCHCFKGLKFKTLTFKHLIFKNLGHRLRAIGLSVFVIFLSALTACTAGDGREAPPIIKHSGPKTDYFIGVGDQLNINVWRNDDLSLEIPVRPDGKISVPLIGDVTADKKTPEGLASIITERLSSYLKNPQVTVMVTNPSSVDFQRRVRVTGAVNTPLSMAFREGMTVLDLILLADGPNEYAALSRAKLYRKSQDGFHSYPINLNHLLNKGNLDSNYSLQPSDVISVPERLF